MFDERRVPGTSLGAAVGSTVLMDVGWMTKPSASFLFNGRFLG